jgi:uncharacterized membrane protein YjgN (DUF898 family)
LSHFHHLSFLFVFFSSFNLSGNTVLKSAVITTLKLVTISYISKHFNVLWRLLEESKKYGRSHVRSHFIIYLGPVDNCLCCRDMGCIWKITLVISVVVIIMVIIVIVAAACIDCIIHGRDKADSIRLTETNTAVVICVFMLHALSITFYKMVRRKIDNVIQIPS